MSRVFRIH
jgi:hypothetical protein